MTDLTVTLGRLTLRNPVLVASDAFGFARVFGGATMETVIAGTRAPERLP